MEIQFQQKHHQNQKPASKLKGRNRRTNNNNNNNINKFVGVRQRPSGRWVAEIKDTTQKIRMWLGTFETAEEAARAYDEAACLLRGSNTRTNFIPHRVSADSPIASRIRNLLKIKKEAKLQRSSESSDSSTSNNKKNSSNSISFTSCGDVSNNNNNNNNGGEQCLPTIQDDTQLFDDAYKPDLSNCNDEFELGSSQSGLPWGGGGGGPGFDDRFPINQEFFDVSRSVERSDDDELELSEFDRMKVERQISASLYAMSGVQECMESVDDPAEAFWDLPPLCSLLCWN